MARAGLSFAIVSLGLIAICLIRLTYLWCRWWLRGRPGGMSGIMALREIALQEIAPPPLGSPASTDNEEEEDDVADAAPAAARPSDARPQRIVTV